MKKDNPFRKAIASRSQDIETAPDELAVTSNELEVLEPPTGKTNLVALPAEPRKRGRPATGKRSNDAWIGRTYYVKRETDLDVEEVLLQLRRQGIEVDKSELVDLLLSAWVKWQQGENIELHISEITPRRK